MSTFGSKRNPDKASKTPRRRWGRTIAITLLSLFGFSVLMFLTSTGIIAQALSYLWPTVYYTQVFADVTAEGQRYQLTSTARCALHAKARFWGLVGGPTPKTIEGGLLVKKLPSGAGLVIVGPALCSESDLNGIIYKEKFVGDSDVRTVKLQEYLDIRNTPWKQPRVFLLDNAKNPTRIVSYWKDYVTRPDADIQVHSIRYKRKHSSWFAWSNDAGKEIPWLRGRKVSDPKGSNICRWNEAGWIGFYLDIVKAESQSSLKELAYLNDETHVTEIPYGTASEAAISGTNAREIKIYGIVPDISSLVIDVSDIKNENFGKINYYKRELFPVKNSFLNDFDFKVNDHSITNNQKWMFYPRENMGILYFTNPFPASILESRRIHRGLEKCRFSQSRTSTTRRPHTSIWSRYCGLTARFARTAVPATTPTS